jgi:hypothetical protein
MYPHPPSENLEETLDELRALFYSWNHALPLLDPYASSACWTLYHPEGAIIAQGEFTAHRTIAKFGKGDRYDVPVSADPGADIAGVLAGRVRQALARAGVTSRDDLRAATWSLTRAEELDAIRLTLRDR